MASAVGGGEDRSLLPPGGGSMSAIDADNVGGGECRSLLPPGGGSRSAIDDNDAGGGVWGIFKGGGPVSLGPTAGSDCKSSIADIKVKT